ncbi:MAG: hypothetical protein NTZ33_06430 [Bacteroidetes bacterium]|nr:hypothetical protein [Bacteroidota bacterium]
MKNIIRILLVLSLFSCKTQKQITSDKSDSQVYIEKLRFDTITTPADSSWLFASFKCDSLGQVYLSELLDLKSKEVASSFNFSKGILNFATKREEKKTIIPCKDRFFDRRIKETITLTKTIVKMSVFQKLFFWIGIVSSCLIGSWVFLKIKKLA